MIVSSSLRSSIGRVCVAIAAVCVTSWGASTVEASCGDYLQHPSVDVEDSGLSAIRSTNLSTDSQPSDQPCRGLYCHSDRRSPVSPPPTIEVVVEHWAHFLPHSLPAAGGGKALGARSVRAPLNVWPEPLTPPPRAV